MQVFTRYIKTGILKHGAIPVAQPTYEEEAVHGAVHKIPKRVSETCVELFRKEEYNSWVIPNENKSIDL